MLKDVFVVNSPTTMCCGKSKAECSCSTKGPACNSCPSARRERQGIVGHSVWNFEKESEEVDNQLGTGLGLGMTVGPAKGIGHARWDW